MPTPIAKAPEPELGSGIIHKDRYTTREFMALEWERMWTKVWLLGPRLSDLAKVGDYVCEEIGPESVIFVRAAEGPGGLKALYNVCPHRGNRLRNPGAGRVPSFRCPYHFFEFELDGSQKHIPDLSDFRQGCPADSVRMRELRAESWGGWLWFSFADDAEPLREYLGVLPEHLDPYHFEDQFLIRDLTIEWDCNWKTSVDAFNEVFHVQAIHPQLLEMLDDINVQIDLYERHNRYLVPFGVLSPRYANQEEVTQALREMMLAAGINPESFPGRAKEVRPALIAAARQQGAERGIDYSELNDDQMVDDYHYMIFPNVTLNIHYSGMMLFRQRPHPTDPNKMFFDLQNFERLPPEQGAPPRIAHRHFRHGETTLGLVLDQDAYNLPRVQRGMNSRAFKGLHINYKERRIRHMHRTIDGYLAEGA
ncbi:MAG: aromatic ring-hydroxylating dioxygenase subunit alpha [Deltaproteobacteria bacterium]|nr:aromatic ring-hydroxylating dioxygenase subunit alpha [Deltaproteobacteria bacterium]